MDLEEYLAENRSLSLSEACDRYAKMTGRDSHDIDAQIQREREDRNAYYRLMDGY